MGPGDNDAQLQLFAGRTTFPAWCGKLSFLASQLHIFAAVSLATIPLFLFHRLVILYGHTQSPMALNSPWHGAAVLALGVREVTVHRALLTAMARSSTAARSPSTNLTSTTVKLSLLEAIIESSLARGDAAGAAAVLYHAMDAAEAQSRAVAEE